MFRLIFPRVCPCCGRMLLSQEEALCLRCLSIMPRVRAENPGNEVERLLFGRFPFEHATSFFYYIHQDPFSKVIRQSKFHDQPWLNARFTHLFVQELQLAADATGVPGWPYDIDVIVPIPLHPIRLLSRGYNQSLAIAEELSRAWHLPISNRCLIKSRNTSSQVGLSGNDRRQNAVNAFAVRHPELLVSRHVLLVDDVLTTGATVQSAADALLAVVPGVRISVLTLSFAKS